MYKCINFTQNALKQTTLEHPYYIKSYRKEKPLRAGQLCITTLIDQSIACPIAWEEVHYGGVVLASNISDTNPSDSTDCLLFVFFFNIILRK